MARDKNQSVSPIVGRRAGGSGVARFESRLNQPSSGRPPLVRLPRIEPDTFGRFAESFARFMGTAQFIFWMSVFIGVWVLMNTVAPPTWHMDPYPFQFLTLLLSLQASYAAPLILLAQNRQEQRDRVSVEIDRRQVAQSRADTDYLAREIATLRMRVGDLATRDFIERLISEAIRDQSETDQHRTVTGPGHH